MHSRSPLDMPRCARPSEALIFLGTRGKILDKGVS